MKIIKIIEIFSNGSLNLNFKNYFEITNELKFHENFYTYFNAKRKKKKIKTNVFYKKNFNKNFFIKSYIK
jgi:hypothetical protein